jgi:preprotein translocase subunit YajC
MNTLFLLLDGTPAAPQGQGMMTWIMILLMFVVFYFFMILPQNKRQKALRKFRETMQEGDNVMTMSGIYGKIAKIKDDGTVLLEVDTNVRIKVDKNSIIQSPADMPGATK